MDAAGHPLGAGWAALQRGDWVAARDHFAHEVERAETPEGLYGLARSEEWAGEYETAIRLYERAFAGLRAAGELRRPALIAGRGLGFLYAAVYGNLAAAEGWLARARSLAQDAGECPERGWVDLAEALLADDPERKHAHVRAAATLADRLGDSDLRFTAMGYEGLCLVLWGRIAEGMRLVDEAAAAATGGEVTDYLAVGEIYCKMLLCCELVMDVRRAQEWMTIADSFGRRANALWVSAICRMHYGGILTVAGRWPEAEQELSASARLYDGGYRALRSAAVVRLADLRVRQGRYEEAARLLAGSESDAAAVTPLARLHLVRGEAELAVVLLRRALGAQGQNVLQVPWLALLSEAEAAAGRAEQARQLCARLIALADRAEHPQVRGTAAYAAGLVCSSAGDADPLAHFESALSAFTAAGMPLERGRARLEVARCLAGSSREVARAEARAALTAFEDLAAGPDADAAAGLLRQLGDRGRHSPRATGPLTTRESEVLGLITEGLANDEIAGRLYLSKRTVEHHVGSILAKLEVSTRAELMAQALRRGRP